MRARIIHVFLFALVAGASYGLGHTVATVETRKACERSIAGILAKMMTYDGHPIEWETEQ